MIGVRKLTRGGAVALTIATVATVLAIWAGPALAAGTPGDVPGLASTTHPDPSAWYPSVNASFVWSAATETGGTIAGYSFTFDRNASTVPPATSGAALTYLAGVNYAVGSGPAEDRVADVNGDGKLDIVAENASSNTVSVLLGNGDGTFKPAVSYATDSNPWSLQVGDVNGDGKLDIVTCNEAASTVSVLLGNGDGTFKAAVNYSTGAGTSPECMRLGDLTGDGKLDIITANAGTNNISVLLNKGDGTFGSPTTFSTATHPTSIAVGDLNGDGKQDIVTANYATNNVSVLFGNGDGTFKAAVNYPCGSEPETVELADLNGDAHLDIVTANYVNSASVLLNKGNGTFATNVDYATGAGPYSLSLADLNHDGIVDIVTVNHAGNNVSVLLGNGDGTFATHADYATGNGPFWVALGDFNGDGYGDIAVTNESDGTVSVLLGSGYYRPASGKLSASFEGLADGTWYLHVRAVDTAGVGGPTSTCRINVDTVAPATTASGLQSSASGGWAHDAQTVTLTASDALSGVATTYYTIDGTQHTYSGPFQVDTAGAHTITYWSVDNAGNVEPANTLTPQIDTVAPVTTATTDPSGWTNKPVQVTLAATDQGGSDVAATYYQIGDAQPQTYEQPFTATDATTVTYWSVDNAGNVEPANTLTPQIDTVAPVTTATTDPGWTNKPVQVTLAATDQGGSDVAATYYTIDGTQHTYSGPFQVDTAGAHTITYWSVDNAGNVEPANTLTPQIDTVAPVTTATTDPSGWTNKPVQVTLAATDQGGSDVAATYYQIGDAQPQTYEQPFTATDATTVTYWSVDNAGNVEPANTLTPQIDTVAPVTSSADLSAAGSGWQPGPVEVTLDATDADSGVAATSYQVDDQGMQPYVGAFEVSGEGAHRVDFFSVDEAGNVEKTETGWGDIDSVGPTIVASGLQDNATSGWTTRPQTVTLQATDTGSGMDGGAICYSIDGVPQPDYTAPFVVAGDGSHEVSYYAVDAAGNVGDTTTGFVNIDTTPPVTVATDLVAGPDTGWVHDAQQVTLTAHDDGCGGTTTWYTLDGSAPIEYDGAFTVAGVQSHEITYWSVDALGNREDTQTGYVNIAPDQALITLASGLAGADHTGWRNTPATVTLTPSGGGGTIVTQYRVNGGDWTTYSGPFSVSGDGSQCIDYRSSDDVSDAETSSTGYVNIDTTPPTTTAAAPTTPQRTAAVVVLTPDDTQSGVNATFYRIDKGPWTQGTLARVPAPATHKNDGLHTVSYYSIDNAGNGDSSLARQVTVRIDTTRPAFALRSATRVSVRRGHALSLRYRARDAGGTCKLVVTLSRKVGKHVVKYTYTLSTRHVSSWQTHTLRLTRPRGTYTAVLRLRDPAGNLSAAKTFRVTIK